MEKMLIFPAGSTKACDYAAGFLTERAIPLIDHPSPEVTHLLLDVPSFAPDGSLRGGGTIEALLERLPPEITVIGGNLNHPALAGHSTLDLLRDAGFLAQNAAITAECALQVAAARMETIFADCPVLIIGWGRIGKSLGKLLQALGAHVTIATRKEADRAMLQALGYEALDPAALDVHLPRFRLIFNTAPEPVLEEKALSRCRRCLKIDLASKTGLSGEDVIIARGLPGIYAPESSGKLIAKTILKQTGRV